MRITQRLFSFCLAILIASSILNIHIRADNETEETRLQSVDSQNIMTEQTTDEQENKEPEVHVSEVTQTEDDRDATPTQNIESYISESQLGLTETTSDVPNISDDETNARETPPLLDIDQNLSNDIQNVSNEIDNTVDRVIPNEIIDNEIPTEPSKEGADASAQCHTKGTAPMTLLADDVCNSVAEDGYFPSKETVLAKETAWIYAATHILWQNANEARCYNVRYSTIFAELFDGTPDYKIQAGDLIYYRSFDSNELTSDGWIHTGIVAEVGKDYIKTLEGNTCQTISLWKYSTKNYLNGSCTFHGAWIVDVFGDDLDAREAYIETAWNAYEEAEKDYKSGNTGFDSWHESCYEGVYQNDTIASGYFQFPAAWCQMFVMWCAFNADIVHKSFVTIQLHQPGDVILDTENTSLENAVFSFTPCDEVGEPIQEADIYTITIKANGTATMDRMPIGYYICELQQQPDGYEITMGKAVVQLTKKGLILDINIRTTDSTSPALDVTNTPQETETTQTITLTPPLNAGTTDTYSTSAKRGSAPEIAMRVLGTDGDKTPDEEDVTTSDEIEVRLDDIGDHGYLASVIYDIKLADVIIDTRLVDQGLIDKRERQTRENFF